MYRLEEQERLALRYERLSYSKEAPSVKYREIDKIRRKDLAYEYGGYKKVRQDNR